MVIKDERTTENVAQTGARGSTTGTAARAVPPAAASASAHTHADRDMLIINATRNTNPSDAHAHTHIFTYDSFLFFDIQELKSLYMSYFTHTVRKHTHTCIHIRKRIARRKR